MKSIKTKEGQKEEERGWRKGQLGEESVEKRKKKMEPWAEGGEDHRDDKKEREAHLLMDRGMQEVGRKGREMRRSGEMLNCRYWFLISRLDFWRNFWGERRRKA